MQESVRIHAALGALGLVILITVGFIMYVHSQNDAIKSCVFAFSALISLFSIPVIYERHQVIF